MTKVNCERKRFRKYHYEKKVKVVRDTKLHNWCIDVEQLCGTTKRTGNDLKARHTTTTGTTLLDFRKVFDLDDLQILSTCLA